MSEHGAWIVLMLAAFANGVYAHWVFGEMRRLNSEHKAKMAEYDALQAELDRIDEAERHV